MDLLVFVRSYTEAEQPVNQHPKCVAFVDYFPLSMAF